MIDDKSKRVKFLQHAWRQLPQPFHRQCLQMLRVVLCREFRPFLVLQTPLKKWLKVFVESAWSEKLVDGEYENHFTAELSPFFGLLFLALFCHLRIDVHEDCFSVCFFYVWKLNCFWVQELEKLFCLAIDQTWLFDLFDLLSCEE